MNGPKARDGGRHFTLAARERVCAGDPFNWLHRGEFRRRSDERDLLAALLHEEGKAEGMKGLTAGGAYAAARLGFDVEGYVGKRVIREISELGWLADSGGCATSEALRAALLGAEPLVSREARAREARRYVDTENVGMLPLAAWAVPDDDEAFSEEGC